MNHEWLNIGADEVEKFTAMFRDELKRAFAGRRSVSIFLNKYPNGHAALTMTAVTKNDEENAIVVYKCRVKGCNEQVEYLGHSEELKNKREVALAKEGWQILYFPAIDMNRCSVSCPKHASKYMTGFSGAWAAWSPESANIPAAIQSCHGLNCADNPCSCCKVSFVDSCGNPMATESIPQAVKDNFTKAAETLGGALGCNVDVVNLRPIACECGADACNSPHANYCPKAVK